jgi:Family of unknown function (DUF5654)
MRFRRRLPKTPDAAAILIQIRNVVQTMITLACASFGLISALAWNEAIRATMKKIIGSGDSLSALYTYAILSTVLAIAIVSGLSMLAAKLGGEAVINREAEG